MARGAAVVSEPYETLVVERRGAVGWIIFDRPQTANAMDLSLIHISEPTRPY